MRINFYLFVFIAFLFIACSKEGTTPDAGGGDDGGGNPPNVNIGTGFIYFEWATEGLQKINLQTSEKSVVLPDDVSRSGFDVSWDGKQLLEANDASDDYESEIYTLTNLSNGTIVWQFRKYTGHAQNTTPLLSPDNTLIAAPPTFDDGIIILDTRGNILAELLSINGNKLTNEVAWMPDGTLLIATEKSLYRTNQAFTTATLIAQFNFDVWGAVAANRQGTKIAFRGGNHIWLMNTDGSNMIQVTDSNDFESHPVFSPDGNYLLVGTEPSPMQLGGYYYHMRIIPADGKKYNVNQGADPNVITVVPKGEDKVQPYYAGAVWR
jgi:Tol biopolymer transport system component